MNIRIVDVLKKEPTQNVQISGWVRSFRGGRFIALNDGSCMQSIQVVVDDEKVKEEVIANISTGASLCVKGDLVESMGKWTKNRNSSQRYTNNRHCKARRCSTIYFTTKKTFFRKIKGTSPYKNANKFIWRCV